MTFIGLKTILIRSPSFNGQVMHVGFTRTSELRQTLEQGGLDGGQISDVLRQMSVVQSQPDHWDVKL